MSVLQTLSATAIGDAIVADSERYVAIDVRRLSAAKARMRCCRT
jgi:hypothetical protein